MMIVAASPAFATSPEEDAYQGYTVYPLPGECHFLKGAGSVAKWPCGFSNASSLQLNIRP
jgi:hypothetical protein